jgi:hypothetical protein
MGMKDLTTDSSPADAQFTPLHQRVLGLLFGQPSRRFQSAELIRLAGGGTGAIHRLLTRLTATGVVTAPRSGNRKHYQANADSPVYHELGAVPGKLMVVHGAPASHVHPDRGETRETIQRETP